MFLKYVKGEFPTCYHGINYQPFPNPSTDLGRAGSVITLQDYALGGVTAAEDGGLSKKSLLGNLC